MAVTLPQTVTFRDKKGQTATVRFFVTAADEPTALTDAQGIVTDMAALSVAQLQSAKGAYTTQPSGVIYPTPASTEKYQTVEDKAVFTFADAAGAIHRYQIPAPKIIIFQTDDETVDNSNGLVSTFKTDMLASGSDVHGIALTTYPGGVRIRKKLKRKFNIFTLNPAETGPGE
jgi:hypothetical protein